MQSSQDNPKINMAVHSALLKLENYTVSLD